jgi:predicted nucleic acid-binding protein
MRAVIDTNGLVSAAIMPQGSVGKDDKFLEVAIAGQADDIVSGDEDLLITNPFSGISIIPPRAF